MTQAIVTCLYRNKVKTYIGELIGRDFGGVHIYMWDKKGSGYIKFIKTANIINIHTEEI